VDLWLLAHTLIGTALVAAGTNAWNQVRERDVDALMNRTRRRPLPSGRLTLRAAAWFASAITVGGVAYLAGTTSLNTLIGAVPGALPIVGGWTAAGGSLGAAVAALFGILFLWQLPHFLAIAWLYREDYRAGGLKMLGTGDESGQDTGRMVVLYALALLPISLLPTLLGITGPMYFYGALGLGVVYAAVGATLLTAATTARAWRVFFVSIVYLPALLTLMVLDKVAA
jgi:protoheme IX farnesyltransferase